VLATDDAQFSFPEAVLGLSVTGGVSRLLPWRVGPLKAKDLLLLGERISGAEAGRLGLVNAVVPDARAAALEWARAIADKPAYAGTLAQRALDSGTHSAPEPPPELDVGHALIPDTAAQAAQS